ncbi:MAG TPA: TIM-barrel domain-containing protein, partial [Terriglobales bacterium]
MNARWAVCLSLASLFFAPLLMGQTPVKSDSVVSYTRTADGVDLETEHGILEIRVCTESMVHIVFRPPHAEDYPKPWVLKTAWSAVAFTVKEDPNHLVILSTKQLRVTVERDSSAVVFQDGQGRVLVRESASPAPREVAPVTVASEHAFRVSAYFDLAQDEALYGMGQHQTGLLNQRSIDLLLMQDNTNITIPFLISSRGYGLLWNNASLGKYENHYQPKLALRAAVADGLDYYFMYGPEFDRIIAAYRTLTGTVPMLPLWAYGFWQSRYQYRTQQEMLEVAAKYRQLKVPLDNLVLDFD